MAKKKPGGGNPKNKNGGRITIPQPKKLSRFTRVNRRDPRLTINVLGETLKALDAITGETGESS